MLTSYIYRHIRLDKNEPFYIGVGTKRTNRYYGCIESEYERAYSMSGRNNIWKRIVSKTNYCVDIIFDELDNKEARGKEMEFMHMYGFLSDSTGSLSNILKSNAGYSNGYQLKCPRDYVTKYWLGKSRSQETKDKLSIALKGVNNKAAQRSVVCLNTNIEFESIKKAAVHYGLIEQSVSKCCHNAIKKTNGLSFAFVDKEEVRNHRRKFRKVICTTYNKKFNSIKEASIYYQCNYTSVRNSCIKEDKRVKSNGCFIKFKYL